MANGRIAARKRAVLMTATAMICSMLIMTYTLVDTALAKKSSVKSWSEQQEIVVQIENAY